MSYSLKPLKGVLWDSIGDYTGFGVSYTLTCTSLKEVIYGIISGLGFRGYSLNFLHGGYIGGYTGECSRGCLGARSLDWSL